MRRSKFFQLKRFAGHVLGLRGAWPSIAPAGMALAAIGSFYLGSRIEVPAVLAQVVAAGAHPFYLERTLFDWAPGGKPAALEKEICIRRSDGTTVRLERLGTVQAALDVRVITYVDGRIVRIVDALASKSTFPPASSRERNRRRVILTAPPDDCGGKAVGSLQRFEKAGGSNVAVLVSTRSRYRITRWSAPALGCEELYYKTEELQPDGSFRVMTESRLTRLNLGEPQQKWFDPGTGFTEMKPSKIQQRALAALGIALNEVDAPIAQRQAARLDREYAAEQRRESGALGIPRDESYIAQMKARFGLSSEQVGRLKQILQDTGSAFREAGQVEGPAAAAIRDMHNARVRAILTPDQQVRFDEFRRLRERRLPIVF